MLHRMILFEENSKQPLCDLNFTRDVTAEHGAILNTFKAIIKFSKETALQELGKIQFVRNQQVYEAYVYQEGSRALLLIVSELTDDFLGKMKLVAKEALGLADPEETYSVACVEVLKRHLV